MRKLRLAHFFISNITLLHSPLGEGGPLAVAVGYVIASGESPPPTGASEPLRLAQVTYEQAIRFPCHCERLFQPLAMTNRKKLPTARKDGYALKKGKLQIRFPFH